jgi:hypothetical protein
MSAAATAAGYLYASGRLRGRGAREQEEHKEHKNEHKNEQPRSPQKAQREEQPREPRERIRVAVLDEKPRRAPKIEYRTRKRWTAGA